MKEIPKHIIERDKQGVEKLTYYGVPVTELDRDGLLAALNVSEQKARTGLTNFQNYRQFYHDTQCVTSSPSNH